MHIVFNKNQLSSIGLNLVKKVRLIWLFYQGFIVASIVLNLCCMGLYLQFGPPVIVALAWFKMATLALILFFINGLKANEYFYYFNQGIAKQTLWLGSMLLDVGLFVLCLLAINLLN